MSINEKCESQLFYFQFSNVSFSNVAYIHAFHYTISKASSAYQKTIK